MNEDVGNKATLPKGSQGAKAISAQEDIFQPGEVLGRCYEIQRVLGAGGMGQVFEAFDMPLNRTVAIKAAWPQLPGPPLRAEARALAAFRHPSLVTVHTIGVHRAIDYIVMERIYGVSLHQLILQRRSSKQQVSIDEAMHIITAIAEGLSVVHQAGIAHRDIKPGNVMLTPDKRVVLMDFGLVLPEFDMASQEFIAGSPPYMAPEALTNELAPGSGPLIDIYALGVTAFELITGEVPRDAESLDSLLALCEEPPPPTAEFRDDVPEPLEKLIGEMLKSDPAERPADAEALIWQLKAIQEGKVASPDRKPTILIVDDDKDLRRVLSFYVQKTFPDAKTHTAEDGEEGLALALKHAPDVMLLDLHMPKMNGMEVCMYLQGTEVGKRCSIVAISAGAQEHDRQLLHSLGIRHFLTKGQDLSARISELLAQLLHRTVE
ncbi:MAG: serine/threonine-protein kinase [Myxococcota bacterium]